MGEGALWEQGSLRPLLAVGAQTAGAGGETLGAWPPSETPCGVELASIVEGPQAYHMGIIDILQVWSVRKRLERFAKTWLLGKPGRGISATPPLDYAQRFTERVICDVFDAPLSDGGGGPTAASASHLLAAQSGRTSPHQSQCPYHGVPPAAVFTSPTAMAVGLPSLRATANSHAADADATSGEP